jgi:hypothetical protein
MPSPYSDDLRWKMVYQRLFYEKSYEQIASLQLFVSPTSLLFIGRLGTRRVMWKPCRLGRPTGSIALFPHEEYIILDCDFTSHASDTCSYMK